MNIILSSKIKLAAFGVLKKECNMEELIFILRLLQQGTKEGAPWKELAEALDEKDNNSRELIGEAILLYRALKRVKSYEEAERITRKVITASAIAQLKHLIPKIKKKKLETLDMSAKELFFKDILNKFPNIDYEMVVSTEDELEFTIHRCRLVELVQKTGHPELSNAFCEGDFLYFSTYQSEVLFKREKMIGAGCETCDFKFSIKP